MRQQHCGLSSVVAHFTWNEDQGNTDLSRPGPNRDPTSQREKWDGQPEWICKKKKIPPRLPASTNHGTKKGTPIAKLKSEAAMQSHGLRLWIARRQTFRTMFLTHSATPVRISYPRTQTWDYSTHHTTVICNHTQCESQCNCMPHSIRLQE